MAYKNQQGGEVEFLNPLFFPQGHMPLLGLKTSLGRETRVREWGNPHVSTGKSARAIYRPKRIKKSRHRGQLEKILIITKKTEIY